MRVTLRLAQTAIAAIFLSTAASACVPGADTGALPAPVQAILAEGCENSTVYITGSFLLRQGQSDAALPWLKALEARGWQQGFNMELPEGSEAASIAARLNARAISDPHASPDRRLEYPTFFPEGIAADGASGRLFLGSLTENLVAVLPHEGPAEFWSLPAHDRLRAVYGIKYDTGEGQLWVLRNRIDVGDVADDDPASEILLLDGQTGALVRSWAMPAGTPTELNDLCLTPDHAYITDSRGGRLLVLDRAQDTIRTLETSRRLFYPNGIVCDGDDHLYIADALGLVRVGAETGASVRLDAPEGQTLGGLDGLALDGNTIIAVQNGIGQPRLIAIDLTASPARITLLDSGNPAYRIPTTVAVMNGTAHIIANSQIDQIDAYLKAPANIEGLLSAPVVLKLQIEHD